LRIKTSGTLAIDWHMVYKINPADSTQSNEAHHIFRDYTDPTTLYLAGMYESHGTIFKFQRRDGKINWQVDFHDTSSTKTLDSVTSYAQATGRSHFVACGDKDTSGTGSMAAFFRMENNGQLKYFYELQHATADVNQASNCKGIHMEESNSQVTVLLSTDSPSFKTSSLNVNTGITDMALFVISDAGTLVRAKHISLSRSSSTLSA